MATPTDAATTATTTATVNSITTAIDTAGNSTSASTSADVSELVQDPEAEVARNEVGDAIKFGVAGRKKFQKIFVRALKGKKSTEKYTTETDAPSVYRTMSILPTVEDKEGRPETLELAGTQQIKTRKSSGVLPVEKNILRALIPTTEFISTTSNKYYVACYQTMNLCAMRNITSGAISYFDEYWANIPSEANVKVQRKLLGEGCKTHVAKNKQQTQRIQTAVPESTSAESAISNAIAVTKEANTANVILMQYSIWELSRDRSALDALEKTIKNILPDITKKPAHDGTLAFYDFSVDLNEAEATQMVEKVKASYPNICELDINLVMEIHSALHEHSDDPIFLIRASTRFVEVVGRILHDIAIFNKTKYISSTWTVSTQNESHMVPFVSALRESLCELKGFFTRHAKELREQHGGIQNYKSLDELMIKIGNTVDKTALVALSSHVFAIHGEQLATANSGGSGYIDELITAIDGALGGDQTL
ncbi:hypothetical protein G6011_02203 [Alternaria panax]|uniref:Uncharacterized protein n=1 Tax=Alternaria panax TaxID=48097 RepID=A0AAD4I4C4_9PLEO|nr:hypothetical protein G6011_02203 [Alternaria panax]